MVVETDHPIREVLTIALQEEGYRVISTSSYKDAVGLGVSEMPNLVLIDYKFDGRDAMELVGYFRDTVPGICLLAISCNTNMEDCYARAGFDGFILKPFDLEELFLTVAHFLRWHYS